MDRVKPEIIPMSDIQTKDEFLNVKNISRDDILAACFIPPALMGVIPQNTSGFGDVEKATNVFAKNEIVPLQSKLKQINQVLGM